MAKKAKIVKPDESKREKFKRVVTPRVKKAVKAINLIGNCAGSGYEHTADDVATIFGALDVAKQQLRNRFERQGAAEIDFELAE